jgi:competence protein ComEC
MRLYDIAFYVAFFFLIGVFIATFINYWQNKILFLALATILLGSAFFILNKHALAFLTIFLLLGSFYYFGYDFYQQKFNIAFDQKQVFSGLIEKSSYGENKQDLVVSLASPYYGKIKITTSRYPSFNYGDVIEFEGSIKKPVAGSYADYLAKDGIFGLSGFPRISLLAEKQGSFIKTQLFKIKSFTESSFKKVLSQEKASFLAGLTLGETAEFSKEFKEKLKLTGTSHLVALSGYNVTIIVQAVTFLIAFLLFSLIRSRFFVFILSTLAILGFVIMTGAEASVVRAAIMTGIVLLANQVNRVYSFRNAVTIAAFLMVLINPKVLVFDIGFQLSFAALLGIVYLKPTIIKFFKVKPTPGFLSWRENLLTTFSAQMAVLPILLGSFGFFSPIAILTNILILTTVPLTMVLGFLTTGLSLISHYLAQVSGWLVGIFLSYELGVIDFFSNFKYGISVSNFSLIFAIIYTGLLIGFVLWVRRRKNPRLTTK